MVVPSLAIGGGVGVLLSGGFIWWEVGRYATPQVPVTLFDERKLLTAYTVGLFVGVPLALAYLLFLVALANGALVGGLVLLVGLAGGAELAQYLALRTTYWKGPAVPFYALALRAGIGGILALTVLSSYLGSASLAPSELAPAVVRTLAVVALEITGALVTLAPRAPAQGVGSHPLSGVLFGVFGFFLIGLGTLAGTTGELLGAAVALVGSALVYRRLRHLLADVPPPRTAGAPLASTGATAFGRTDAKEPRPPP